MTNEGGAAAGLSDGEVLERREKFGRNEVPVDHPSKIKMLLHRFWGLIPWMLEFAVFFDLVAKRWAEAAIISVWLVFSCVMGFLQEDRAQRALALLRQRLVISTRVRRDGRWKVVPASELVPDDRVYLRVGDIAPADIRVADGHVQVDQSQLTGESLPVGCDVGGTVYAGSLVTQGETTGIIVATGSRTYFGKTAELVRLAKAPARLEILIVQIAKYLSAFNLSVAIVVLLTAVIRGVPLMVVLPFLLVLMVLSVPVAAPMMFTMSATLGSRMLAKNGILVTRLSAIEDGATMDVLCLDKTGTLTENRLVVDEVVAFAQHTKDEVLRLAASTSNEAAQNAIDLAILGAARGAGDLAAPITRIKYSPFDQNKKYSECLVRVDGREQRIILGEPFTIAKMVSSSTSDVIKEVERVVAEGKRVLALAVGEGTDDLQIMGLIALNDAIRVDSKELISKLRQNGIRVLLVTGDNEVTARAVANQVGLTGKVAPHGFIRDGLTAKELDEYEVFARVLPEDKFILVRALQRAGHVVGMTGDGVNDAPALRQADVGIAVSGANDVAKAAASLVLTRPGLEGIITAIGGSRKIYQRMKNFVLAMVSRKLSLPPFVAVGVLAFGSFVVSPMLMIIHMFTSDISTMALSTDQVTPSPQPDRWSVRALVTTGLALAALLLSSSIAVFWAAASVPWLDAPETQTVVFLWMVFSAGQATPYATRNRGFFWKKPYPSRWMIAVTAAVVSLVSLLATMGWLMAPIPASLTLGILGTAVLYLFAASILKVSLTAERLKG